MTRTPIKALIIALPFAMTVAFATPGYALFDKESKIKWSDVPPAVQKTVKAHANGGKVDEVEKEAKSGEKAVYEFSVKAPGDQQLMLKVDESGRLVALKYQGEEEQDIAWAKVPEAVKKTIAAHTGGKTAEKVEREMHDGKAVYEAKIKTSDDHVVRLKVGDDGRLRELETRKEWF